MQGIQIQLNGEPFQAPEAATVADLVRSLGLPDDRVAVELDRRIAPRAQWSSLRLKPGAAVEIVQIVGGG